MGKFKTITAESYFQPSIPIGLMVAEGVYVRPATLLDFLRPLDAIQLGDGVPGEVVDLFEVAKGASAYGYLYWPLFTVGVHYAILAVEAALHERYRRNGGPDRNATMGVTIPFLERKGLLPESQREYFTIAQKLRNEFSHPKFALITGPGFPALKRSADLILSRIRPNSSESKSCSCGEPQIAKIPFPETPSSTTSL